MTHANGSEDPPERQAEPLPEGPWLDQAIRTFAEDLSLWPVLVVAILIFATFGAAILLLAAERRLPAVGALFVLVFLTLQGLGPALRRRKLSPTGQGWARG